MEQSCRIETCNSSKEGHIWRPKLCGATHHEVRPRKRKQTSAHQCSSPSACAAFVGSDLQARIGDSQRKTFQTGSRVWPRHVTRPRSNQRTSLIQLPLPLTSINTSPQNGYVSITHYLLDVHRLAICTTEELSLQPAWTPPISSSELRQRPHPSDPEDRREGWAATI